MTPPATCADSTCESPAAFRLYEADAEGWRPICERHALAVHPSLELAALLESGYLRPVEIDPPDGPPPRPKTARGEAFREIVEDLLDWSV